MIDFTNCPIRNKWYAGANGGKISIIYEDKQYMLKFPSFSKLNRAMSYTNGCISEYLGSHIFDYLGIPAQETLLGTYSKNGKDKIVVACKDFTIDGTVLQDFASLKNTVVDSNGGGYGTELSDIIFTIESQTVIEPDKLKAFFWDMFIVDAFLGNWDRHNGNWGFLYNEREDKISIAPIFDCGSCLYPSADKSIMETVIQNEEERNLRIFEIPPSVLRVAGYKIKYFDFISSLQNNDCNNALKRIIPRIKINEIKDIIDNTPYIDELQKQFYFTMLCERKEKILDYSLKKLQKRERNQSR